MAEKSLLAPEVARGQMTQPQRFTRFLNRGAGVIVLPLASFLFGALVTAGVLAIARFTGWAAPIQPGGLFRGLTAAMIGSFLFALYLTARYLMSHREQINWLLCNANWNAKQLREHGLDGEPLPTRKPESRPESWPWGAHHTELLGHLDAAARKWWTLYDPASPDTAPTNDMVSDWLHSERGVSRDKAKSIASILRADGLRTGRR